MLKNQFITKRVWVSTSAISSAERAVESD